MLIDWFTVGAQVLNFAVLAWLMKRFLYRPILDAIDQREKGIAATLADAAQQQAQARQSHQDYQRKTEEVEQQRSQLLAQAHKEADAERQRLLAEARQAADALAARRQLALQADAQRLSGDLLRRTQAEVLAITRRALGDLAGTSLEARMTEVFATRLQALAGDDKAALGQALAAAGGNDKRSDKGSDGPVVRSAFELPAEQRTLIQTTVQQVFGSSVPLRFETAPALVAGIELSAQGHKVAWSLADYLGTLQQAVDELLRPQHEAEAARPAALAPDPASPASAVSANPAA